MQSVIVAMQISKISAWKWKGVVENALMIGSKAGGDVRAEVFKTQIQRNKTMARKKSLQSRYDEIRHDFLRLAILAMMSLEDQTGNISDYVKEIKELRRKHGYIQ